jgi:hypothetical protein
VEESSGEKDAQTKDVSLWETNARGERQDAATIHFEVENESDLVIGRGWSRCERGHAWRESVNQIRPSFTCELHTSC